MRQRRECIPGRLKSLLNVFGAIALAFGAHFASAADFKAVPVFKGSDIIWGFDFLSEDEILFTEKNGGIRLLNLKTGKATDLSGGPKPVVKGQGGLMDVKINKADGKTWVYFTGTVNPEKGTESKRADSQTTALFRGDFFQTKSGPKITELARIFEAEPAFDSGYHFGSRIAFKKSDGQKTGGLFITLGERNERDRAQDLSQHWGKVLHLSLDGKPASSNPYIKGEKVSGKLPRPEIYSYGHRNPQGIAIHPVSNDIYVSEHGPRGGDEINLIKPANNYGWPIITYGREYWGPSIGSKEKAGLEQAKKYFVPSIAPGSLMIYSGKKYPDLKGRFFLGALVLQHLNIVDIKSGEETRLFKDMNLRVRNVAESPAGDIFFSTDSGQIFRLAR